VKWWKERGMISSTRSTRQGTTRSESFGQHKNYSLAFFYEIYFQLSKSFFFLRNFSAFAGETLANKFRTQKIKITESFILINGFLLSH